MLKRHVTASTRESTLTLHDFGSHDYVWFEIVQSVRSSLWLGYT